MALRPPSTTPLFHGGGSEPQGREWTDRVPAPELQGEAEGRGGLRAPSEAALPSPLTLPGLLFPDSVFFLFCLQIKRTGPRCPYPMAVFMAA